MSDLSQYDLTFTCDRTISRILVLVRGRPMWLTHGAYQLLLDLLTARHDRDFVVEFLQASPMAICRLRRCLDKTLRQKGIGKQWIECAYGPAYRLSADLTVAFDKRFLRETQLIAAEVFSEIKNHYAIVDCDR